MNRDERDSLINDYLDDVLPVEERHRVEQLLRHDADFADEVERQRRLLVSVAALPRRIAAPSEAWDGIAARIDDAKVVAGPFRRARQSRVRTWTALAAASLALVISSSALTVVALTSRSDAPGGDAVSGIAAIPASTLEAEYQVTIGQLENLLADRKGVLSTETIEVVEASLATIDQAIREATAALRADPNNIRVLRQLAGVYQQKVDVLKQVTRQASML